MSDKWADGQGAVLWSILGVAVAIALLLSLFACATIHRSPDGTVSGAAIGEDAMAEYCVPRGEAGVLTSAPQECVTVRGGAILPSLLDGVGTVVSTVGKVVWGWLGF